MNTQRLVIPAALLAALVAAPALAGQPSLQGETKPPVEKEAKPAAASKEAAHLELTVPVTGLTRENVEKVKTALKDLTASSYECPECGATAAKAGDCAHCQVALAQKTRPMFATTTPTAEKSTITMDLTGGQTVRLSQIESALRSSSVQVDRKAIKLQGPIALVYRGGSSKEQATKLQEAAVAAKLADAKATFDADTKEIHVRLASGATTWESAAALGSKLDTPLTLADAQWTAAKPRS